MRVIVKKIIKFIVSNRYYILSFLFPAIIFMLTFMYLRVFLYNKYTIAISDMSAQYISFFIYLKRVLGGTANLFYSFEKSIGGNMMGTFFYYLSSPVNLLVSFFSVNNINKFLILNILIKFGLSGLTMFTFLKYHYKEKDLLKLIIFSTSYAVMAYNVAYYFSIMWLDGVYLAPLVMLGIDKIIDNKKSFLYISSLSLSIIFNFYIGYMICIFSVIYYLLRIGTEYNKKTKENIIKSIVNFSIYSIMAGFISAIAVIPTLKELSLTTKANGSIFSQTALKINLNIFDIISKFAVGAHNYKNLLNNSGPMIYVGIFSLVLVVLYFLNDRIKLREKILSFGVIVIFVISTSVNYISYIWHGFNKPVYFAERYSFLFSLFLIFLAFRSFINSYKFNIKTYIIASFISTLPFIPLFIMDYVYLDIFSIIVTIALVQIYLFILYLYNNDNIYFNKKHIMGFIFLVVFAELTFNFYFSLDDYIFNNSSEISGFNNVVGSELRNIINKEKSKFYRIDNMFELSKNDPHIWGYNGYTAFNSNLNSKTLHFFNNNGYNGVVNFTNYRRTNPIIDSILSLKYLLYRIEVAPYYNVIGSFDYSKYDGVLYNYEQSKVYIAENPYSLSLGFMVSNDSKEFLRKFVTSTEKNIFGYSDSMLQTMTGDYKRVFKYIGFEKLSDKKYLLPKDYEYIYGYCYIKLNDNKSLVEISLNDKLYTSYSTIGGGFFGINTNPIYAESSDVIVTVKEKNGGKLLIDPLFYYFQYDIYEEKIKTLRTNQMNVIINNDSYIKGEVVATENRPILFTSIPFEPGWTSYVDGKKVEIIELYNTFNGIELTPGKHTIEFKFYPPGLNLGIFISTIGLILVGLYFWKGNKLLEFIINMYLKYEEIFNYLIVGAMTTIIGIVTYAMFAKIFRIYYLISSILSWIIAVIFAFFANKLFVFKSSGDLKKEIIEFIKFRLLSLVIDIAMMYVLVSLLSFDDLVSKIIVQIVIIFSNYVFSKLFIFKE